MSAVRRSDGLIPRSIPESNEIHCCIPIGYPSDAPGPLYRKPVKKVAFWNRFGEQWPFAAEQTDNGWTAKWVATKEDE